MKKTIILSIILIFIAVSGLDCKLPFGNQDSDFPSMLQYRTGTKGLEIAFEGLIKEVPEDNVFQIPIEIKNMGASDIEKAYVLINTGEYADFEESEGFTKIDDKNKEAISKEFSFSARSPENPEGQIEYVILNAKALGTGAEESISAEIKATACFDYSTHAMADVCIDAQQFKAGRIGAKACEVRDVALSGGQGGPLAVTKIEYSMLYESKDHIKPYFKITIENKGKGDVFKLDSGNTIAGCLSSLKDRRNKASVSATLVGKKEILDCDIKKVYFKDKETLVICIAQLVPVNQPAYITPIDVSISYGYVITESTNIKIKNIRVGRCMYDFPRGSKCNDNPNTLCGQEKPGGPISEELAKAFESKPIPTKDCAYGCCKFIGEK